MSTEADPARPGAHAWLLAPLLLTAAGPAFAGSLPHGPQSLLTPSPALIAAASTVLLWAFFAWPAFRGRQPMRVASSGGVILLLAAPFVAGLSRLAGISMEGVLSLGAVLAAGILTTGVWLAGPGRCEKRDRAFAAAAVLVLFAAPLGNYACNEFAGVTGDVGYRVSPILCVRRIVLGLPDADPSPFYWLCLAATTGMLAPRFLRRAGPPAVLMLVAATALGDAPGVRPLLGRYYAPDRPVPLLVTGGTPGERTWLRVPGRGRFGGMTGARGAVLTVPLPRSAQGLEVRFGNGAWLPVTAEVEPVEPGRLWVACIRQVPQSVREDDGIAAGRVAPSDLDLDFPWIAPDGIVDLRREKPELEEDRHRTFRTLPPSLSGALGEMRSPARRIWEEGGDLKVLRRLFEADSRVTGNATARTVLALLAGFAIAAAGAARFLRSSRLLLPGILALAAGTTAVIVEACPAPPEYGSWSFVVEDGPRAWRVRRYRAARDVVVHERRISQPIVLGDGAEAVAVCRDSDFFSDLDLPLRAHETRYLITLVEPPEGGREPRLIVGPEGLSLPGGVAASPSEFLLGPLGAQFSETSPAGVAVRKLLRLDRDDLPREKFGVAIEAAGGNPFHVRIFRLKE